MGKESFIYLRGVCVSVRVHVCVHVYVCTCVSDSVSLGEGMVGLGEGRE